MQCNRTLRPIIRRSCCSTTSFSSLCNKFIKLKIAIFRKISSSFMARWCVAIHSSPSSDNRILCTSWAEKPWILLPLYQHTWWQLSWDLIILHVWNNSHQTDRPFPTLGQFTLYINGSEFSRGYKKLTAVKLDTWEGHQGSRDSVQQCNLGALLLHDLDRVSHYRLQCVIGWYTMLFTNC